MSDIIGGITAFVEINTLSTTQLLRVMAVMVTIVHYLARWYQIIQMNSLINYISCGGIVGSKPFVS